MSKETYETLIEADLGLIERVDNLILKLYENRSALYQILTPSEVGLLAAMLEDAKILREQAINSNQIKIKKINGQNDS